MRHARNRPTPRRVAVVALVLSCLSPGFAKGSREDEPAATSPTDDERSKAAVEKAAKFIVYPPRRTWRPR